MIRVFNRLISRKPLLKQLRFFSTVNDTLEIPTIDYDKFLNRREGWKDECKKVADCLYQTGILVVRDPVHS